MEEPNIQDVMVEVNDLRARVFDLEQQSIAYNNTIIALSILANVKAAGFKYITPEDYKNFLKGEMHPFAKAVMDVANKANKLIAEEEEAKRAREQKESDKENGSNDDKESN